MINQRNINDITISQLRGETIRLIHDGTRVITAFRGDPDSVTETTHQATEFATPQAAFSWVTEHGLDYDEVAFVEQYGQAAVDSWKQAGI